MIDKCSNSTIRIICNYYRSHRSCSKVIFSQACVKSCVNRGWVSASVHARIHTPWADTPPCQQTDTAADGTHPTGMHSCLITGRNEVVAKVMFLQACVCPRGGGVCLSA